jgi:hypothetical protein
MKKSIWITTSFVGFHQFPLAPPAVAFLRNLHRHRFGVRVYFQVTDNERQLEFFLCQAEVNQVLSKELLPQMEVNKQMSCEAMAEVIFKALQVRKYPVQLVSVDEDGENGAQVSV